MRSSRASRRHSPGRAAARAPRKQRMLQDPAATPAAPDLLVGCAQDAAVERAIRQPTPTREPRAEPYRVGLRRLGRGSVGKTACTREPKRPLRRRGRGQSRGDGGRRDGAREGSYRRIRRRLARAARRGRHHDAGRPPWPPSPVPPQPGAVPRNLLHLLAGHIFDRRSPAGIATAASTSSCSSARVHRPPSGRAAPARRGAEARGSTRVPRFRLRSTGAAEVVVSRRDVASDPSWSSAVRTDSRRTRDTRPRAPDGADVGPGRGMLQGARQPPAGVAGRCTTAHPVERVRSDR